MATIGSALTAPESGWRRYDDSDSRFKYTGTWNIASNAQFYGGTGRTSIVIGDSIVFNFYGTKLRIISNVDTTRATNIRIQIDGVESTYSQNYPTTTQCLVYEITGLSLSKHSVKIIVPSGTYTGTVVLDAIDLDDTGYLMHPTLNQMSSLDNMQVGDCIPCKYTASTSGQAGYFSELGTCIAAEIPVTSSATPDGLFYLIKTDKGTLIADRVIQHSISWDTLNNANFIEGYSLGYIPFMRSDSEQGITITASSIYSESYHPYTVADGKPTTWWSTASGQLTGFLKYDLGVNPKAIYKYSVTSDPNPNSQYAPKNWTFEGSNDNISWVVLDTQINQISWAASQKRNFNISNKNSYRYYRINVTAICGNGDSLQIADFQLYNNSDNKIRSLSGGCAYIDSNGNSSLTDKSLGAWPVTNEWDKYLVNSDLKGKITKGDNNIWHYNPIASYVKDTPILTMGAGSNTWRTFRPLSGNSNPLTVNFTSSSNIYSSLGFRPVLNYVESDIASEVIY